MHSPGHLFFRNSFERAAPGILKKAAQDGLIRPLCSSANAFRLSLYADGSAIFANPDSAELTANKCILETFGRASGLHTNLEKKQYLPYKM